MEVDSTAVCFSNCSPRDSWSGPVFVEAVCALDGQDGHFWVLLSSGQLITFGPFGALDKGRDASELISPTKFCGKWYDLRDGLRKIVLKPLMRPGTSSRSKLGCLCLHLFEYCVGVSAWEDGNYGGSSTSPDLVCLDRKLGAVVNGCITEDGGFMVLLTTPPPPPHVPSLSWDPAVFTVLPAGSARVPCTSAYVTLWGRGGACGRETGYWVAVRRLRSLLSPLCPEPQFANCRLDRVALDGLGRYYCGPLLKFSLQTNTVPRNKDGARCMKGYVSEFESWWGHGVEDIPSCTQVPCIEWFGGGDVLRIREDLAVVRESLRKSTTFCILRERCRLPWAMAVVRGTLLFHSRKPDMRNASMGLPSTVGPMETVSTSTKPSAFVGADICL
jgi:hypothetical protein